MNIGELEVAVRAIVHGNPGQPALAGVVGIGNAQLPEEIHNAVKSLASRANSTSQGKSILRTMTQGWI